MFCDEEYGAPTPAPGGGAMQLVVRIGANRSKMDSLQPLRM